MRRGKYTFPAALFLYGILTLNMTNVILNEVKNPRNKGRSGYMGVHTPIFGIAAVALLLRNDVLCLPSSQTERDNREIGVRITKNDYIKGLYL